MTKEKLQVVSKLSIVKEMENVEEEMDKLEKALMFNEEDTRQVNFIKDEIAQLNNEARNYIACISLCVKC